VAGTLTLRLQRGDTVVELQGEADAVQAAFADLKANGLGALAAVFSLGAAPVGVVGQLGGAAGLTPQLTNSATSFRFVFDSTTLPSNQRRFAADVNGDGRPDNGFANIINALASQSLALQGGIDTELRTAQLVVLLTLALERATPAPDQRAAVTLLAGKPVKPAENVYIIDPSMPGVTMQGRIVAGRFASDEPGPGVPC